jgi:hypothetical protein
MWLLVVPPASNGLGASTAPDLREAAREKLIWI